MTKSRPFNGHKPSVRQQSTCAANAGVAADKEHRAVAPPLHLAANYAWDDPCEKPAFDYSRSGNPTRTTLEQAIAELEGGARGVVTASGMAAIDLVLCLLDAGDRVIAPHDCYGGTHRLLCSREKKGHLKVDFVDFTDDEAYEAALAKGPKLVMIETPSNPLLRVTDVRARAQAAKRAGAVVAADNTFLSPILQQPLSLGCDIVIHSTTKYINGHSDVVGGAVVARDAGLGETLAWWANNTGVTGAPFDSYLTLRGLRTLETRIERQQATAQRVIDLLKDRAEVERVFYPGLEDHPGHEIAAAQQKGFGAMFSVEFASDIEVVQLLRDLSIFTVAESLGGFESLVCIPATMTHASMPPEARAIAGISETLVRFSIGLEHAEDLSADLLAALDRQAPKQKVAPRSVASFPSQVAASI